MGTYSSTDFISFNEILSDVLRIVDDEQCRYQTEGYYRRQVRRGVEELAITTLFNRKSIDIKINSNKIIPFPSGCFNESNMWVYNGDQFSADSAISIEWKRNFSTDGISTGYFSRNNPNSSGAFVQPSSTVALYFYNIISGDIHLSDSCLGYETLRIDCNGYGENQTDATKVIPVLAQEAITDYASWKSLLASVIKRKDHLLLNVLNQVKQDLDYNGFRGSWSEANKRLKSMSDGQRKKLQQYIANLSF